MEKRSIKVEIVAMIIPFENEKMLVTNGPGDLGMIVEYMIPMWNPGSLGLTNKMHLIDMTETDQKTEISETVIGITIRVGWIIHHEETVIIKVMTREDIGAVHIDKNQSSHVPKEIEIIIPVVTEIVKEIGSVTGIKPEQLFSVS